MNAAVGEAAVGEAPRGEAAVGEAAAGKAVVGEAAGGKAAQTGQTGAYPYVGLVTRVIAFVLDAAVINVVAILVEVGTALVLSLLHIPHDVRTVIAVLGGVAYVLWSLAYFVGFWSTTGQTPGDRVLQIRVQTAAGSIVGPKRAAVRFGALILAALLLFTGFLPILFDAQRRGLHDRLAGTVVVEAPQTSLARVRLARERSPTGGPSPDAPR